MPTGILSKQDIEAAIDRGELVLNAVKSNLQACSYDLRVGTIFKDGLIINRDHQNQSGQFIIKPGEIIHLLTEEEVNMPNNIMATVFPRNFDSSEGLLVLNPGHIDPGYKGAITVTAVNLKKTSLALQRGRNILTIVFEEMPNSTTSPYNRNISRKEREEQFNAILVGQDTHNLSEIIIQGSDSPYPTKQEVELMFMKHWMTVIILILSAVAAVAGVVAVIQPKSEDNKPNPRHLESPSPTPSPKGTQS